MNDNNNNNFRDQFPGLAAVDSMIQVIIPALYLMVVTAIIHFLFIGIVRLLATILLQDSNHPIVYPLGSLIFVLWSIVFIIPILGTFFTEPGSPYREGVIVFEVWWATWVCLVPGCTLGLIGLMIGHNK